MLCNDNVCFESNMVMYVANKESHIPEKKTRARKGEEIAARYIYEGDIIGCFVGVEINDIMEM